MVRRRDGSGRQERICGAINKADSGDAAQLFGEGTVLHPPQMALISFPITENGELRTPMEGRNMVLWVKTDGPAFGVTNDWDAS